LYSIKAKPLTGLLCFRKGAKKTGGGNATIFFIFYHFYGCKQLVLKKFSTIAFILYNPLLLGFLGLFLSFPFLLPKPPSWQRFRAAGDLFFLWWVVVGLVGCVVVCFGGF